MERVAKRRAKNFVTASGIARPDAQAQRGRGGRGGVAPSAATGPHFL